MTDDREDPYIEAFRLAWQREHDAFVAEHGYHPGYRVVDGVLSLVPLENDGIVIAEE